MKKLIIVFLISLISFLSLALLLLFRYNKSIYVIELNGNNVKLSSSDIGDMYEESALKELTIVLPDREVTLDTSLFAKANVNFVKPSFIEYILNVELKPVYTWTINKEVLDKELNELLIEPVNAFIKLNDDGKFSLVPEVLGSYFDIDNAISIIESNLYKLNYNIDLTSICIKPSTTSKSLKDLYDSVSWINDFVIEYDNGVRLTSIDFMDYWTRSGLYLNDFSLDKLSEAYDTTGKTITFKTSNNETVNCKYVTYGTYLNKESELKFIKETLRKKESVKGRSPELRGHDNINGTYVEVSIKDQHVWHYVDYKLCCESNCVTGTRNLHDTPTGVFYVTEKIPGKYLKGEGYTTWVNRWMRLTNSGIGFHDANWRGRFGDKIYTYSGSHGCINLPSSYAYKLYDEISRGIPVVIYG